MTLRPPIDEFPELVSTWETRQMVAHSSTDWQEIDKKYHSPAEQQHVERWANDAILEHLAGGAVRATGRLSTQLAGTKIADRWESRRYRSHDPRRAYIPQEFWTNCVIDYQREAAKSPTAEYVDIRFVIDDVLKVFGELIQSRRKKDKRVPRQRGDYGTPYLELMNRAISELKISKKNQPKKSVIVEWFLKQEIAGRPPSRHFAEAMATFIRLPESQSGGNRPWRVHNAEADEP